MKQITISLLTFFALTLFVNNVKAQCREQMVYNCATECHDIFLRDFNAKLDNSEDARTKWSVVLNKNYHYRFCLCTPLESEGKYVLSLYPNQNIENTNQLGSTYDKKTKDDYSSFDYFCKKSGTYYVSIKFKEGQNTEKSCAVGILSIIDTNN